MHEAQLGLIPRIVIDVETKTNACQYHFVREERHMLGCTLNIDSSTATATELNQISIMEVSAYIKYFKQLARHTKEANVVADYLDSAWTYHQIATRGGENVKNADHMLRKISDKLHHVAFEILGVTANGKTDFSSLSSSTA